MVNFLIALVFIVAGCGYTTGGGLYAGRKIIITPAVNKIDITSETRKNSNYVTFPILIENKLTNKIISKFNIDGNLKVVNQAQDALKLTCIVNDYAKEALRYTGTDDVQEQRLRLYVATKLISAQEKVLINKTVVGETTYYLSGANQKSEEAAQVDLIDDTARRISEAVTEEW